MILVDSNYLLGLHDSLDSLHCKCLYWSNELESHPILYLDDVLKEVQTLIAVRKSQKEAFAWIDSIYENESSLDKQYNLSSTEYFEVLNYWRSLAGVNISFVDAEIIYLAQKHNFKVLSFDEQLMKILPSKLRLN